MIPTWRQGTKVKQNVYEGDRPVCQTHNVLDAVTMTLSVNYVRISYDILKQLEWIERQHEMVCPLCFNGQADGHVKDCKLAAMIAVAKTFVERL